MTRTATQRLVAGAVALVALGGCGGDERLTPSAPAGASAPCSPDDPRTDGRLLVATEVPTTSFEGNQVVDVQDAAFTPEEMTAAVGHELTFRNATAVVQCVRLTNAFNPAGGSVGSGAIAPGQAWAWTPPATLSLVFVGARAGQRTQITVQPEG